MRLLLDHGGAFIGTNDIIRPDHLLLKHLEYRTWNLESVALLLRRPKRDPVIPVQNLSNCLHLAVHGSSYASASEIKDVLALLIKAGADVYERDEWGNTVSDAVCDPYTARSHDSGLH